MKTRRPAAAARLALLLASCLLAAACGEEAPAGKVGRRSSGGASSPAEAASRGEMLYGRSGCAVCHGPEGRGDGLGAAGLVTQPRDFTQPAAFRAERTVEALAQAIAKGSADGSMPPYAYMGERDRQDLAAFVLSFAGAGAGTD